MQKKLSDTFIKKTLPKKNKQHFTDVVEPGLLLVVHPTGGKVFQFRYKRDGKQKYIKIGKYPATGLQRARERVTEYKEMLDEGLDPREELERQKKEAEKPDEDELTFKTIGDQWLAAKKKNVAEDYYNRLKGRMAKDVYPYLGHLLPENVKPTDVMDCLKLQEDRGALEQLQRVKRYIFNSFELAMSMEIILPMRNPAGFPNDVFEKHEPSQRLHITEKQIPDFLKKLSEYTGMPNTRIALELLFLTNIRPGEVLKLEWEHIKEDRIAIPRRIMKKVRGKSYPHDVPISTQTRAKLEELRDITGDGKYLFPTFSITGKTRTQRVESLEKAVGIIGYKKKLDPHGLRATFSTLANESLKFHPVVIEKQLAHQERNQVKKAYDRSKHWDERVRLSQWWGDWLDAARKRQ